MLSFWSVLVMCFWFAVAVCALALAGWILLVLRFLCELVAWFVNPRRFWFGG